MCSCSEIFILSAKANVKRELAWYCIRTKPKQENKVAMLLEREVAVEVLSLSIRFQRLRLGSRIWVRDALFPAYIFARLDFPAQHRHVRAVSGVSTIVHFGDKPAEVPMSIIDELRKLREDGDVITVDPVIEPGAEVAVTTGPLRGLRALVTRVMPARQRVAILLEMLGMYREVEIETARVLPRQPRRAHAR
jgi:transcriptional antiterminator RfaH